MKLRVCLVSFVSVLCTVACDGRGSVAPLAPTAVAPSAEPAPDPPSATPITYPGDGAGVIAYVVATYPEKLAGGVSPEERVANMRFLRDRVIEVGKCGGLDLGWNLKRGGPEISNDFITERVGDQVIGHDIAFDYDNTSRPLQMYWGGGDYPSYKEYPQPACQ